MPYSGIIYNFLVDSVNNCYFDSTFHIYHLRLLYYPKQFYTLYTLQLDWMIRLILLAILFYHFYLFGNNPDAYFSYGDIELDSWDIASNKNIHSGVNLCYIWIESACAFSLYRDLGLNDLLFTLNYYRAVYRSNNSIEINGQRSKENNNSLVKDLNN